MDFRPQNPRARHNLILLDATGVLDSGKTLQLQLDEFSNLLASGSVKFKEHFRGQYSALLEAGLYSVLKNGARVDALSPVCIADPLIFLNNGIFSVPDVDGILGDGADGDVTITKTTHITQNMWYNNLTVNKFYYPSGTVSVAADSATINGSGTSFLTDVAVGDTIYIGDESSVVQTVTNDTQLVTVDDFSAHTSVSFHLSVTLFGDSYKITVKNTLYLYGTIANDGGRPIPYSGWIGVPAGFYPSMGDGPAGGLGGGGVWTPGYGHVPGAPGTDGAARINTIDLPAFSTLSGVGGGGGNSVSTTPIEVGGPGGAAGLFSSVASVVSARNLDAGISGRIFTFNGVTVFYANLQSGGAGGGGQGGGSVTIGVGGPGGDAGRAGAPGGILYVAARTIKGDGKFSAKGGNGDQGTDGLAPPVFPNCGNGGGGGGGAGGQGGLMYIAYYDKSGFTGTYDVSGGSHGGRGRSQMRNPSGTGVNTVSVAISALTGKGIWPIVVTHPAFSSQEPVTALSITGVGGNTKANQYYTIQGADHVGNYVAELSLLGTSYNPTTAITTWSYGTQTILRGNVFTLIGNKNYTPGTGTMNLFYGRFDAEFGHMGDNGVSGSVLLFQLS